MFARVENGVTKFSPKKQKTRQKFGSETAVCNGECSFFGCGKTNFWRGVYLQNWLASDHPGAYTSMPHAPVFYWRKI